MTTERETMTAEIAEWTVFRLANEADCSSPDSVDSVGACFLSNVRDAALELCAGLVQLNATTDEFDRIDDNGSLTEIADGAPSVYTYTLWQQFTDLGAWTEDVTEFGEITDMEDGARVALYMIADRLAHVIVDAIAEAANDDDESDVAL
jgi:hypothetical protein